MSNAVSLPQEHPAFFRCGEDDIFGILTRPLGEANGVVVLLIWGTSGLREGGLPSFGKNQVRARLARRLAAAGYHALRLDCAGNGESTRRSWSGFRPDAAARRAEVPAAAKWLRKKHLDRFVLVGSGWGARTALQYASKIGGVEGVALLTPPLLGARETHEAFAEFRAGRSAEWVSPSLYASFREAMEDRIRLLLLYGREDWHLKLLERAMAGRLGQLLEEAGSLATVRVVDGLLYHDSSVRAQAAALDVLSSWLAQLPERTEITGSAIGD